MPHSTFRFFKEYWAIFSFELATATWRKPFWEKDPSCLKFRNLQTKMALPLKNEARSVRKRYRIKSNPRVVRRRLWRDRSNWKFVKNKEVTMLQKRKKRRIWYAGKSVMAFKFWVRYLRFYPGFDLGFYFWGDILNCHLLFFKPSNT